jgi:hypothetical protein
LIVSNVVKIPIPNKVGRVFVLPREHGMRFGVFLAKPNRYPVLIGVHDDRAAAEQIARDYCARYGAEFAEDGGEGGAA